MSGLRYRFFSRGVRPDEYFGTAFLLLRASTTAFDHRVQSWALGALEQPEDRRTSPKFGSNSWTWSFDGRRSPVPVVTFVPSFA
jgi:hypothetical protein